MTNSLTIFFLSALLANAAVCSNFEPDCICKMDKDDFGSKRSLSIGNGIVSVSPENQKVKKADIGKLVSVDGVILTQQNYHVRDSTKSLGFKGGFSCPDGFRTMSKVDLEIVNQSLKGSNFWMVDDKEMLNMPEGSLFLTSTKVYPLDYSENSSAFDFFGARIRSADKELSIQEYTTIMDNDSKMTKCVLDSYQSNDNRFMEEDLMQDQKHAMDIASTNAIDYQVVMTGGIKFEGDTSFQFKPENTGCFYLKMKWKMWDGTVVTNCKAFMVAPIFGSAYDTSLKIEDFKQFEFDLPEIRREEKIHFRGASAPIAAKPDGGAHIFFSREDDAFLRVIEVNDNMEVRAEFDLKLEGKPLSIACLDSGFVIYYQDEADHHKSSMAVFSANGILKWSKTIMNNGDQPESAKEQLTFHDEKGDLAFGMQAMYRPDNGKLVVGRNRILLIFSHYNNFKAGMEGFQGHTGDSVVSFDLNGNRELLGLAWGTSHSLAQRVLYDGLQFVTSSLGDAYPQHVTFASHDGKHPSNFIDGKTGTKNRYEVTKKTNLIPGTIPGDGDGRSCGRIGGLHVIRDSRFRKYAQVYARRTCTSGINGEENSNQKDEIGVLFFDRNLNRTRCHIVGDGYAVNVVRSALYGRNIFILFSKTKRRDLTNSQFLPNTYNVDDSCYMVLVGPTGMIVSSEVQLPECVLGNDDIVTLQNGNVAWTFVDKNGKLRAFTLAAPPYERFDGGYSIDDIKAETGSQGDDSVDATDPKTNDSGWIDRVHFYFLAVLILGFYEK